MISLGLNTIWETKRNKNHIIHNHSHSFYELVYYSGGTGISQIENNTYNFNDKTFAVIPPKKVHSETHFTPTNIICLGFCGINDLSENLFNDSSGTVYNILNAILKEAANQHIGYENMIAAKLNELYIHIKRTEISKSNTTKSFEYIINYIKENYHEKIRLSDCAKQLNLSYDYFQHKFKELTGFSPQNFLLEHRLEASKVFLSNNLTCTETAYRCGFSTSAQFSMLFKKKYGISPKEYKTQFNL